MKMAMLIPIVNFLLSKAQLYLPGITLSAKDNEKLFKLLMEEFEISVYWNEVKTKRTSNNTKNQYWNLTLQVLADCLVCLFEQRQSCKKHTTEKYYLRKDVIKNYDVIINGKNFYDESIVSDI